VRRNRLCMLVFATTILVGGEPFVPRLAAQIQEVVPGGPVFEVDLSWPKAEGHFGEQGNWDFGAIAGIAIDPANDHVWVATRPATMAQNENFALKYPSMGDCCLPTPPVVEFDAGGKFIQGWGGPKQGHDWLVGGKGVFEYDENGNYILGRPRLESGLDWWAGEQRISVDHSGNIWLVESNHILKFTNAGKLLVQIGPSGKQADQDGVPRHPTMAVLYAKTNELFVSDMRRVMVFDGDAGKLKHVWGAYGNKPDDSAPSTRILVGPAPKQFNNVQALAISNDGLVYVADSENNRVQVFRTDGTFLKEGFVARDRQVPSGTVVDMAFSADSGQQFLYVAGADDHIRILNRETLQTVGSIGRLGHYPGQFYNLHSLAVDSKGDIYAGEDHNGLAGGRRVQKLLFKGIAPAAAVGP
jgi:DNA-binding beta-propeller fold protein YncE